MNTSMRRTALACALLATTAAGALLAPPASAQEASVVAFPVRSFADGNGVDLLSGEFTVRSPGIRIGGEENGLTFFREVRAGMFREVMLGTIDISSNVYSVGIGGGTEQFTLSSGVFTPVEQRGSTLSLSSGTYTYRQADGTTATFLSGPPNFGNARGIAASG